MTYKLIEEERYFLTEEDYWVHEMYFDLYTNGEI